MIRVPVRVTLAAIALVATTTFAGADPITLTCAYFSSDRTSNYLAAIKPFVDAVNAAAEGKLVINVAFSGALGRNPADQAQLVLDGKADLAFVVAGYTPDIFPDVAVIELPGLFSGVTDATKAMSSLVAARDLAGFTKFYVVGAFAGEPETIHGRVPIETLADLKGKRIRVNDAIEAETLTKLGATPVELPINQIVPAMSKGDIDATTFPANDPLTEFGISRIATHHYLLGLSAVPLALVMNCDKFDALPKPLQDIITKYSGQWLSEQFIASQAATGTKVIAALKADPRRLVVEPSADDLARAQSVFDSVTKDWLAHDPHNATLLKKVETTLANNR